MKIAITDYSFPSLDIEESILRPLGHEIASLKERKSASELATLVADADAVITQFAPVDAHVIASMQRAKVIVRYGIGYDNVDVKAARERGIPVCNIPDYCIDEVADHTLAFILGVTRQVVPNTLHVRDGKWGLATPLDQLRTLRDQTVGIVVKWPLGWLPSSAVGSCMTPLFHPRSFATRVVNRSCSMSCSLSPTS
jgi:D-3-phosphoglycerate dehydrogenase